MTPEKHIWRGGGWRRHAPVYIGAYDRSSPFRVRGVIRCSEPNCEMNHRSDRNPQETERSIDARRGFFCTARGRGLADWCSAHGDIDRRLSIAWHIQTEHDMDYETYRVISELDYHRSGLTTEEGYAEERRLGIAAAAGTPQ